MMPTTRDILFDVLARTCDAADRFDVADVLYGLTDQTVEVLTASAAGVSLTDRDGSLKFVSANSERAGQLERVQQESKQGPCHRAFTTGVEVVVNDISEHAEWPIYRAKAAEIGIGAVIGIPLSVGDRRLGALNIYHGEVRAWSDDDVKAARILANIATSYVLHASQLDEVNRVKEQLQQALESRIVIEQAKGLLAGELSIGLEAAFNTLREHARRNQATLRSVADAVVRLGLRPQPSGPDVPDRPKGPAFESSRRRVEHLPQPD